MNNVIYTPRTKRMVVRLKRGIRNREGHYLEKGTFVEVVSENGDTLAVSKPSNCWIINATAYVVREDVTDA